jgi:peptide chain release factor 3
LFCSNCSSPRPKDSETRLVDPKEENVWICFKIHANMDPKHRDRLAFIKIVSGTLKETNRIITFVKRKNLKFSSPNAFLLKRKRL